MTARKRDLRKGLEGGRQWTLRGVVASSKASLAKSRRAEATADSSLTCLVWQGDRARRQEIACFIGVCNSRHSGDSPRPSGFCRMFQVLAADPAFQAHRGRLLTARRSGGDAGLYAGRNPGVRSEAVQLRRNFGKWRRRSFSATPTTSGSVPGWRRSGNLADCHQLMNWDGPILADSGGFQVFSLSKLRRLIEEDGVRFQSHIDGNSMFLSCTEVSIEVQADPGQAISSWRSTNVRRIPATGITPPAVYALSATMGGIASRRWFARSRGSPPAEALRDRPRRHLR